MKFNKIVSFILASVLSLSCFFTMLGTVEVFAAETSEDETKTMQAYEIATENAKKNAYSSMSDKLNAELTTPLGETGLYATKLLAANGNYQLYANTYTGEVYFKNKVTGDVLSTNPCNLTSAASTLYDDMLSQVAVKFRGTTGEEITYNSFKEAATRGQINVKQIRNGIRVEYTIGRTNTNYLLPGWITEDRFDELVIQPIIDYLIKIYSEEYECEYEEAESVFLGNYNSIILNSTNPVVDDKITAIKMMGTGSKAFETTFFQLNKLKEWYARLDANPKEAGGAPDPSVVKSYPICGKIDNGFDGEDDHGTGIYYVIYAFDDEQANDAVKRLLESYVKTYCMDTYSYDEKAKDTEETGYVASDSIPAYFRLSLEYTIANDGTLSVRLPANGIRFDSANFTLLNITLLKYFGAGSIKDEGYIFYPDGSGALVEFSDIRAETNAYTLPNPVYGEDYAYYEVADKHQESVRIPVYGIVDKKITQNTTGVSTLNETTGEITTQSTTSTQSHSTGFVAYLTEGETLSKISLSYGGSAHEFAMVYPTVTPIPYDEYTLKDAVSVSTSETKWLVSTEKRYLDSFYLNINMLTDPQTAAQNNIQDFYETSWIGMANAYRDYFWKGYTPFDSSVDSQNLPLYIESFGSMKTTERILSIPFTVNKALTKFEDIITMYEDLADKGIDNINFKLTGFANGGLKSTYPTKVKWTNAVGGLKGYNKLLAYSSSLQDGHLGVYPEFEFNYISEVGAFDGIGLKADAARTVDNRYASKMVYDYVFQDYDTNFDILVSPVSIAKKYEKFQKSILKRSDVSGISAGSLGSDLNSTFYDDHPYNREDARSYVTGVLSEMQENLGSLMVDGGNAYALHYVDHVLGAPIDSSNYLKTSRAVPFYGMVMHGYFQYAGDAINEAGDDDYHLLRSIESGASIYYLLSYSNTSILKEDEILSRYYSLRYDIWGDDLVEQYTTLNNALKDVQSFNISNEIELIAERIPDTAELINYRASLKNQVVNALDLAINTLNDSTVHNMRFAIVAKRLFEDSTMDLFNLAEEKLNQKIEVATRRYNLFNSAVAELKVLEDTCKNTPALAKVASTLDPLKAIMADTGWAGLEEDAQKINTWSKYITEYYTAINDNLTAQNNYTIACKNLDENLDANMIEQLTAAKEQAKRVLENSERTIQSKDIYHRSAVIAMDYVLGQLLINKDQYYGESLTNNKDAFLKACLAEVMFTYWGSELTADQVATLNDMYDIYKNGGEAEDQVSKFVTVMVDRNSVVASVLALYQEVIEGFDTSVAEDFQEAITTAIDSYLASYYAPSIVKYINTLTYTTDRYGNAVYETLTPYENAALKAALQYFYVQKQETATVENVNAFVEAFLTNANNTKTTLTDIQKNIIVDVIAYMQAEKHIGDIHPVVSELNFKFDQIYTTSEATDAKYQKTIYSVDDESVRMVVYSNGVKEVGFILNYNIFDVTVILNGQEYVISPYGFVRVELN